MYTHKYHMHTCAYTHAYTSTHRHTHRKTQRQADTHTYSPSLSYQIILTQINTHTVDMHKVYTIGLVPSLGCNLYIVTKISIFNK